MLQMVIPALAVTTEVVSVDGKSFGEVKVEPLPGGLVKPTGRRPSIESSAPRRTGSSLILIRFDHRSR
jgi:hypothetical protein